ncbi:DUF3311 domain-containing protein [Streptomyces sp. BI20]|uniref:DUF3311 domain-containing protein n=1 Tax=Streptomyces sp. BI20 TaxID=3403460 RepID=UPI003C73EEF7
MRPFWAERPHLLWLLVPFVVYLGALPAVNRVLPTVFGVPFLLAWFVAATLVTPVAVALAWRGDRRLAARHAAAGRAAEGEGEGR